MKILLYIFISIVPLAMLNAQDIVPDVYSSNGSSFIDDSIMIDWTIGETIIETYTNYEIIVSQGFHQTYQNHMSVENLDDNQIKLKCVPNPISDIGIIMINGKIKGKFELDVVNILGEKILEQSNINNEISNSNTIRLDSKTLPNGVYYIIIHNDRVFNKIIVVINK